MNKLAMEEIKRQKRLKRKQEAGEHSFNVQVQVARANNDYIKNTLNGYYYLARYNMIVEQINNKAIKEKIDGCPKSEDYMRAECALMKMQAIMGFRSASFAKEDLLKKLGCTEKDIIALERDYYEGKIIREVYDDRYKKGNKAEFVKDSVGN